MADNSTSPDLGVGSSPPPADQSGRNNSSSSSSNNNADNSSGQDNNNNNNNNKGNNEGQGQGGEVQVQVPPGSNEGQGQGRGNEVQVQVPPGNNEGQRRGSEVQVQVPPGSGSQVENSPPLGDNNNKYSGNKSSSSLSSSGSLSSAKVSIIAGIVGLVVIFILLAIICIMCKRRRKRKRMDSHPYYGWQSGPNQLHKGDQQWQPPAKEHTVKIPPPSGGWRGKESSGAYTATTNNNNMGPPPLSESSSPPNFKLGGFNKSTFTYEELASATKGFDQSNMLGQGGFGYVHKGVLPNGKEVAVKSLKSGSGQGDREFHAEVEIITRVHHKHLVTLVGYCISRGQRMLVYEFVPNNTLEYHLHKKSNPPLDFSTRLRIALGSAKGLAYLHEDCHPRIIHRDIKASNILLEDNFEAMVADFGLAKLTSDNNTHVSTRVMGTFGYLAPEYASSGKLTEKSDVFSFGVMLLELITGRRPVDPDMKYMEDSLVDWSRPLLAKALETGNYRELADPRLEGNYNSQEMQRMVACAAASIRHSSKKRPKMSQIVRALEGDVSLDDLNEGVVRAGQRSVLSSSDTSSDFDSRQYSLDLRKFRQMAFDTQDFASSEYGGTRDYGTNSGPNPNMH